MPPRSPFRPGLLRGRPPFPFRPGMLPPRGASPPPGLRTPPSRKSSFDAGQGPPRPSLFDKVRRPSQQGPFMPALGESSPMTPPSEPLEDSEVDIRAQQLHHFEGGLETEEFESWSKPLSGGYESPVSLSSTLDTDHYRLLHQSSEPDPPQAQLHNAEIDQSWVKKCALLITSL